MPPHRTARSAQAALRRTVGRRSASAVDDPATVGQAAAAADDRAARATEAGARVPVDLGALAPDDPRRLEAERRRALVEFAEAVDGGWLTKARAVAAALEDPELATAERLLGPPPSRMTLARWTHDYITAERHLGALVPIPSPGRPPEPLHPELAAALREALRVNPGMSLRRLHARAESFCKEKGRDLDIEPPTYAKVRRWRLALPLAEIISDTFGTKAARAQTQPKATTPTIRANDVWGVDGVKLPIRIKIVDHTRRDADGLHPLVEARPQAVFVMDHHSRAILAAVAKRPSAETPFDTAFNAAEVLAVIAGAILPDLAPPELARLAIGAPNRFRLDGSGEMGAAKKALRRLFGKDAAPDSEPNAAWTRGEIERLFRTIKNRELGDDLMGDERVFLVFDEKADPRDQRQRENHDESRLTRVRTEVPLASLPSFDAVARLLRWVVQAYNSTPHSALGGRSPLAVWQETAPEPSLVVPQLYGEFAEHTLTLDDNGLRTAADAVFNSIEVQRQFPQGSRVRLRRDPFDRAVWVFPLGTAARLASPGLFVPNKKAWAAALDPKTFNAEVKAEYKAVREERVAAQRRYVAEKIGEDAAVEFHAAVAERTKKKKGTSRKQKEIDRKRLERQREEEQPPLPGLPSTEELRAASAPIMPRVATPDLKLVPSDGSEAPPAPLAPAPEPPGGARPSLLTTEPEIARSSPRPPRHPARAEVGAGRRAPLRRVFDVHTYDEAVGD